jgi:hypothetical protein
MAFENNVKRKRVMLESKAMQVKPAKQPLANSQPASQRKKQGSVRAQAQRIHV